jgi:hypothetical protein
MDIFAKINEWGFFAWVVTWVGIMIYVVNQSHCLRSGSCDEGNLFLSAVMGIGMLVPSCVVGLLVSELTKGSKR